MWWLQTDERGSKLVEAISVGTEMAQDLYGQNRWEQEQPLFVWGVFVLCLCVMFAYFHDTFVDVLLLVPEGMRIPTMVAPGLTQCGAGAGTRYGNTRERTRRSWWNTRSWCTPSW